jgi:phosphoglycolate phosphatase
MNHRFRSVIFDFDYTLADSSRGVIDCIGFAMAKMGFPAVTDEAACQTIGLSLPDTFTALVGEHHAAQSDEFARLFIQRASKGMTGGTVLFDAVPGTIDLLKRRGIGLGIVSTKFRYRIEEILARESLLEAFDAIVGGEDVTRHKPDPEGLLAAIDRMGNALAEALYVGDSVVDAETAKQAQVPFAAVLSGTTPREAFAGQPVVGILESLHQLPALLDQQRPNCEDIERPAPD